MEPIITFLTILLLSMGPDATEKPAGSPPPIIMTTSTDPPASKEHPTKP